VTTKSPSASITMVLGLLPKSRTKSRLLNLAGHDIHPSARMGPSLFIRVSKIVLGEKSRIGTGNIFRNMRRVELGYDSAIGQWNWISSAQELVVAEGQATLVLGKGSALTSRHYCDASGGIAIGDFTTVAGVRSTFITHGIDVALNVQLVSGISIGDYCLVSSNCSFVPGASIANHSLVAMGSVIAKDAAAPGHLLAGVPAKQKKAVDTGSGYFVRSEGKVFRSS
jgi:acetyltransferase-like isoleucine patch superfamily enzyme